MQTFLHSQSHYKMHSLTPTPIPPSPCLCLPRNKTLQTSSDTGLLFNSKLNYLKSLNVNPQKALTLNPKLRSASLSTLHSITHSLLSLGLAHSSIGRILDMHPSLLTSDPHLTLYPLLDFLIHEVNIPFPDVSKAISRCPRLLVSDLDSQLRPTLLFLKKLGFVGPFSINCQSSLLLVYSVESTLMVKVEFLKGLGFSFIEVKNMIVRSPGILTLSVENNLMPKVDYFLNHMCGDLKELREFPQFFSFSLEKKIKPRHRLLFQYGIKLPLWKMLKVSDGEFHARLIDLRLRMAGEKT